MPNGCVARRLGVQNCNKAVYYTFNKHLGILDDIYVVDIIPGFFKHSQTFANLVDYFL